MPRACSAAITSVAASGDDGVALVTQGGQDRCLAAAGCPGHDESPHFLTFRIIGVPRAKPSCRASDRWARPVAWAS